MNCPALRSNDPTSFATALDIVDCRSGQAIEQAFSRLFGAHGALLPALTILLTLYVAIFAIGLLTGRSRLGVSTLTPRVLTLGMALTFATSWAAYQNVVWTLAAGAPDELATLMTGTHGSATGLFARGLDHVFHAIAEAAQEQQAHPAAAVSSSADQSAPIGTFSGPSLLWLSAIILLMGTVGALITAKIALAGLVAIGPLFIVLALFRSTWGLFEGWLKALVLLMMVPLFVVLIGGGALAMIVPVISGAVNGQDNDTRRAAIMLLLAACIYSALIVMVVKMAVTIVGGWRLPFASQARPIARYPETGGTLGAQALHHADRRDPPLVLDDRVRSMMSALPSQAAVDRRSATIATSVTRLEQAASSAPGRRCCDEPSSRIGHRATLSRSGERHRQGPVDMKSLPILLAAMALAEPAAAGDPRIATLFYNPSTITLVNGRLETQSTIEFAPDEHIENVAVGNSASWQVTPNKHANLLFVKPMSASARTNMTVITDKRTYLFDLGIRSKTPPVYVLRFTYPKPVSPPRLPVSVSPPPVSASRAAPNPEVLNFAWKSAGAKSLLPTRIFDDGRSTWLQWAKDAPLPAILTIGPGGDEGPTNYSIHGDYVVLDSVPHQIVLRRGKQVTRLMWSRSNNGDAQAKSGNIDHAGGAPDRPAASFADVRP